MGYSRAEYLAHQYSIDNDWEIVESLNIDVPIKTLKKIKKIKGLSGYFETSFAANDKLFQVMMTIEN